MEYCCNKIANLILHQTFSNLIKETVNYLNQAKNYLENITPAAYQQPIAQMSNGTIGKHTRHFLECYQCLLEQATTGKICYDSRDRNTLIEEDPKAALAVLESIIEKIKKVDLSKKLVLKTSLPTETPILTNLNRELLHNYEHTTHHLALIRVGLTLLDAADTIPENFGLANATIQHRMQYNKR